MGCNNKICNKYYHLQCVALTAWPEGTVVYYYFFLSTFFNQQANGCVHGITVTFVQNAQLDVV